MPHAKAVLVLDDEQELRDDVGRFVADAGFTVETAGEATSLSDADLVSFDIVLLDIAMPDADGLAVIERLSTLALRGPAPGILLISGRGEDMLQTVAAVARRAHVDVVGVLQKPFEPDDLLALLQGWRPPAARGAAKQWSVEQIRPQLAQAVATRTLGVAFQPKAGSGHLGFSGAEALLAGHLPVIGPVSPELIVEAASTDLDLLMALSLEVVRLAAEGCRSWSEEGWRGPVSINLPFDVLGVPDVIDHLEATLRDAGLAPSQVIFELMEDAIYDSSAASLSVLARLRLAGFGLSLDDVGRRQSGLLQLANLPITEVKIDLQLLAQARLWAKSRSIFASIAELGQRLGLSVVAEGVETPEDLLFIRKLPVDYVQGYLVSRKLPLPDLLSMLTASSSRGALVPPHVAAPLS
ncbi:transcriptional regulator [Azorhizobium oxalatiphilum]|uniref:Transcriptional regulator n=1 Tax=Azorhizobium oxalatiphilum TaxID=980631 RepID=A0A917BKL2_9HYPH|nr:EAL domain-containing response regulator [Azorhizobium oxalatiphilum]GGF47594.1 transcriptional regulator [Azorhizobium oxalatiphilum]